MRIKNVSVMLAHTGMEDKQEAAEQRATSLPARAAGHPRRTDRHPAGPATNEGKVSLQTSLSST